MRRIEQIEAWRLEPGDRFRIKEKSPILNCKAIRTYSASKTYVDCGVTTVTNVLILKPKQLVWKTVDAQEAPIEFEEQGQQVRLEYVAPMQWRVFINGIDRWVWRSANKAEAIESAKVMARRTVIDAQEAQ